MDPLSRLGIDVFLAVAVGIWFVAFGIAKLPSPPSTGRRAAVEIPRWLGVLRRLRGVVEILGGLAVLGAAAGTLLGLRLPFPGLAVGLVLAGLASWAAIEALLDRRWVRLAFGIVSFLLAVFYAGFRG